MALFIAFLVPFSISVVVHSIVIYELVEKSRIGSAFWLRYVAWGLAFPLCLAATLMVLFNVLHTPPAPLLGVFVVIMMAVACVACLLSWVIVLAFHVTSRRLAARQILHHVNGNA
jgi:bacteriorhodopsin